LLLQLAKKKSLPAQFRRWLEESELLKILDRINMNQTTKLLTSGQVLFKDKFYNCLSHHAYRKAFEDSAWLKIETEA
jgi:EAL domain-containing protein (putative c-di-GMP-specific phosphodiesterase class I)